MTETLDIAANRRARKWTVKEIAARVAWGMVRPIFSLSPRPIWGWRRFILRLFGAQIGRNVHVYPTVRIAMPWNLQIGDYTAIGDRAIVYNLGPVHIGARATVSQNAHLCAGSHDWRDPTMPLTKPPIVIGDDCWVCADAFVGPGVTVGARSIVGARACLMKDLAPDMIARGNPALQQPKQR